MNKTRSVGIDDTFSDQRIHLTLVIIFFSVHILEYENYGGYVKTNRRIRESNVRPVRKSRICMCHVLIVGVQQHISTYNKMIPYLTSRSSQLNQEFAFFPTAPPHTEGGIFELRTYQLHPGALLQWEQAWSVELGMNQKFHPTYRLLD